MEYAERAIGNWFVAESNWFVAGSNFGLFLDASSRTVVPLLCQLQCECGEVGIITSESPFLATTTAMMDNSIAYWDWYIGAPNGGVWPRDYVWRSI